MFEATFNQAAVGMSHVSLNGDWLSVNQKLCDIVGYSRDELLELNFQDITHPEDLSMDLAFVEKMLSGDIQTYSLEKRYIRKDKSHVWVNLTVSLVRRKCEPCYFISVVEDIQQRKDYELQLRLMHEKMEELVEKRTAALKIEIAERKRVEKERNGFFELSKDLMAIFGSDGCLRAANPALLRLLGYAEDELYSRKFIEFLHPDDLKECVSGNAILNKFGLFPNIESRYLCKNGRSVLLSWAFTEVPEYDCVYAIARDITEFRQQEIELAKRKKKNEMDSKMQALGRMASGIAHEINNPLTIVYGQSGALKKMLINDTIDKDKMHNISESISRMCARIVDIVNGLRTFTRDGANDPFEQCSLKKILQDTVSFCMGEMKCKDIQLIIEPMPDECIIFCRPTQVSQVILNLLNNAKDAAITTTHRWIRIGYTEMNDEIGLSISDSGNGVPIETRDNLFQPFYTTKEIGKGTGLGLSISKNIIEAHGGKIYLDTKSSHTKFVFTLPKHNK